VSVTSKGMTSPEGCAADFRRDIFREAREMNHSEFILGERAFGREYLDPFRFCEITTAIAKGLQSAAY
jgi:hypothetical protein